MTVAVDLATAHGIKRRLRLRVEGVEYDFWQDDGTGASGGGDRTALNCLIPPEECTTEFDLAEMRCGLSAMTFELTDVKATDGTSILSKIFGAPARWDANPHYRIAAGTAPLQQVEANATNVPVKWTDAAAAAGTIYVCGERIAYGNVLTSNTFTGCNRGMFPATDVQLGRPIRRPQESDGETIPSVGSVPFSYIGARVALHVTTYDNRQQAWNTTPLLLWAGRLDHSIRYVPQRGCWQLTAKSITEELGREVCSGLRSSDLMVPKWDTGVGYGPSVQYLPGTLINLLGASTTARTFCWDVQDEAGAFIGRRVVTVPQGVYEFAGLCNECGPHGTGVQTGAPDVSVEFFPSKNGKIICRATNANAAWTTHTVFLRPNNPSVKTDSHVMNALGFGFQPEVSFVVEQPGAGWTSVYRRGQTESEECYAGYYHPLHASVNGGFMAIPTGRAANFVTAQEAGEGAFAEIKAAYSVAGSSGKLNYVVNYTAVSSETGKINGSSGLTFDYDRWTIRAIPGVAYEEGAWIGYRVGDDPPLLQQACVPIYQPGGVRNRGPYETLLNLLVSTGTPGVNGAYDILPTGWGLGVEASLVDVASFLAADAQIMGGDLAQRPCYVIDEPISWSEIHSREAKLFGYAVVWRNGKLTVKNVLSPAPDTWTVELSDSTRCDRREKPTLDIPASTVINRYSVQAMDWKSGKKLPLITITDADSKEGLGGVARALEIDHPGLPTERGPDQLAELLKALLVGQRGSMLRYPCPVVEVSVQPSLARRVAVGDVVKFSSSFVPDVLGSGAMGTTVYALVTRLGWSYKTWRGNAQLVLLATVQSYGGPYAPSALVNWGHSTGGWNATSQRLYLTGVYFGQSGDDDDGQRFKAGHLVVVVDRCPQNSNNPTVGGPYTLAEDYSNSGKYLSLAGDFASYNSSKEWVVEFANWAQSGTAQHALGAWYANVTTGRYADGNTAQRWGK